MCASISLLPLNCNPLQIRIEVFFELLQLALRVVEICIHFIDLFLFCALLEVTLRFSSTQATCTTRISCVFERVRMSFNVGSILIFRNPIKRVFVTGIKVGNAFG